MSKHNGGCQCKGRCDTRRCKCLKENLSCDDRCKCVDCQNPLNGMDVSKMSDCAIGNATLIRSLTPQQLGALIELPCGHDSVPLKNLIGNYGCPGCNGEAYFYSFCYQSAEQDSCTWHCSDCKTCRDWREWHCDDCNRCVYGTSSPCPRCEGDDGGW